MRNERDRRSAQSVATFAAVVLASAGSGLIGGAARAAHAAVPAARPMISSISARPRTIPADGGAVAVRVDVASATSCSFGGVGIDPLTVPCANGSASETLDFTPNTTTTAHAWTIYAIGKRRGTMSRWRQITVIQTAARRRAALPASPRAARGSPPPTPPDLSANWSGYRVTGGPFTVISGRFTVPALSAAPRGESAAEWVGIGGASSRSLIQAGVTETYDASSNRVRVDAWWEVFPYLSTPIPLPVSRGDEIAVTIGRVRAGRWGIWLTDETTGRSFSTQLDYAGSRGPAEWIVEAPTAQSSGALDTLGVYAPAVRFTDLKLTGVQQALTEDILVADGVVVSRPSALTARGFSVRYGSIRTTAS